MDNRPIGIFDSGIGGLTILQKLLEKLPDEEYIYVADQKNFPYGKKSKEELVALTSRIAQFLVGRDAKLIVVACNTATCHALAELRKLFAVPIVGVVPAIKPAALRTKTGNIGLIATPATLESTYVDELIATHASGVKVWKIGCLGLENIVERGGWNEKEIAALLSEHTSVFKENNIDKLVLGCTHYPFLRKEIGAIFGPDIEIIDSGEAVAEQVKNILREKNLNHAPDKVSTDASVEFFTTGDADVFSRTASRLLGYEIRTTHLSL